jgi:hypothetical protein
MTVFIRKNKKMFWLIIILSFLIFISKNSYALQPTKIIDNFESSNSKANWWVFGNAQISIRENSEQLKGEFGNYSLGVETVASDWYGGGFGRDLPPSANRGSNQYFCIDVWGDGTKTNIIAIKLVDDDNDNNVAEDDIDKSLLYDDEWTYKRIINWKGWKRLKIDLNRFEDSNPGIGDDIWNPQQTSRSQGILKINIICLSKEQNGSVKFKIDNIGFCQ